jgi:AcrR family transcriptional regulator
MFSVINHEAGAMNTRKPSAAADQNNRSRLLQAATDAFAEQGFEGTSLRTIADNAGVSFQLIAYYFGSKEELWVETVDYLFERYLETGKGLGFTPSGNLHEQFHNHLRLLMTDQLQRPQLHKICVQEHLANSVRYRNIIQPKLEHMFSTLAMPYYREVVRLGIVERFTPEEICLLFAGINKLNVTSTEIIQHVLGLPPDSAKAVETQVDLIYAILTEPLAQAAAEEQPAETLTPPRNEKKPATTRPEVVVYPWREAREAGADAGRVKQLEDENQQLKQLVGSLSLEKKLLLDRLTELPKKA